MVALHDLPVELLLDNLLPYLGLRDIFALAGTSKFFTILVNDDMFWQRKLEAEYNFTSRETARTTGWKAIYRGMHRPQVYVWGASGNGRLGRGESHARDLVAAPVHPALKPKDRAGIVSIAAAGWSFHTVDANGRIYAWGQLNAESVGLDVDGFADMYHTAFLPVRLDLDAHISYVTCGRAHALAFDTSSRIWHFSAWGAALRLVSPAFDGTTPDTTVAQLEAGWDFGAALTAGGTAYAWWHSRGTLGERIRESIRTLGSQNAAAERIVNGESVVPCSFAEIAFDPVHLPPLPALPSLGTPQDVEIKLVKIAAADIFVLGLTNAGHVLKLDVQPIRERQEGTGTLLTGAQLPGWVYLPQFSESGHILRQLANEHVAQPPTKIVKITHISAHFHTFFAYSTGESSIVLEGNDLTASTSAPIIRPALQNRDVISVVLGDYHWGALTSDGKLFTWGQFSSGALGLGDPFEKEPGPGGFRDIQTRDALKRIRRTDSVLPVEEPTEVNFGPGKFVVAATAAGWHTGALVLDLEYKEPPYEELEPQHPIGEARSSDIDNLSQWQSPPLIPDHGILQPPSITNRGRGGLIGHQQPRLPVQPHQPQPAGGSTSTGSNVVRGVHHFRVGFAGRGAHLQGGRNSYATSDAPDSHTEGGDEA